MIDARDYKTHDELKEAMENESNIVTKQAIDYKIDQYKRIIFQAEYAIEVLSARSESLGRQISDYHIKMRKKKENAYPNST